MYRLLVLISCLLGPSLEVNGAPHSPFHSIDAFSDTQRPCPPVKGTFSVDVVDMYSESADWDSKHCKLYISYVILVKMRSEAE